MWSKKRNVPGGSTAGTRTPGTAVVAFVDKGLDDQQSSSKIKRERRHTIVVEDIVYWFGFDSKVKVE